MTPETADRLRGRSKALKGESRKWIQHEIRLADARAEQDVKRLRKPEGVGGEPRKSSPVKPLLGMGKHYGDINLAGGSCQAHVSRVVRTAGFF